MAEELKYKIDTLTEVSLFIDRPPINFTGAIYFFEINVNQQADAERGLIVAFIEIKVMEQESKHLVCRFELACSFFIENFSSNIPKLDSGLYDVPEVLTKTINQISISTARGVLYEKLKGTYLHKAILPVIMVDDLKPKQSN